MAICVIRSLWIIFYFYPVFCSKLRWLIWSIVSQVFFTFHYYYCFTYNFLWSILCDFFKAVASAVFWIALFAKFFKTGQSQKFLPQNLPKFSQSQEFFGKNIQNWSIAKINSAFFFIFFKKITSVNLKIFKFHYKKW